MRFTKLFLLASLTAAAALLACAKAPEEKIKVTVVLDWTINTNHTGLYVAQDQGYFKDAGLDVEIQPAPESGAAALLAAGKADFAYSYQEEILQSRAAGVNLTAVASVIQHNTSGFAARTTTGIKRPKDFEGKRYGGWGSPMEEALLKTLVEADGGDPKKVEILNIGSMDFFSATEKTIDFAWIFQGWTGIEAQTRGIALDYLPLRQFNASLDYYTPVIATTQTLTERNPGRVKAFLTALSKGYQFAIQKPDDAAAILLKAAPELNKELVYASQKFLAKEYQAEAHRWGEMDELRWNNFLIWMLKNNLIKALPDSGSLFRNDLLP